MKNAKHLLLILLLLLPAPALVAAGQPNILVIFTDDHGWADLGANGVDPHIRTPNLDQLARDGVRFTHGYVTAPQCTPSRAGLLSGQYQQKLGVEQNGIPLPLEVVTLPERLGQAGYVTGLSGKWHLDVVDGEPGKKKFRPEFGPWNQGFDEYFSGFMQDYDASHALDGTPLAGAPKKIREEGCRVDLQTEWALQFLKRHAGENSHQGREAGGAGKTASGGPETGAGASNQTGSAVRPFFLYVSYMAPHTPLEWPEPYISAVPEDLPKERRSALALIAAIDAGVGRLRGQLRTMGQEENTLIFFLGDNGAPLAPLRPKPRNPWDGSINLPMRGQKGMLTEGGIRVPFVAAWPGRIPSGRVFGHPVISLDIAATSLAAASLPVPPELDGVDLLPHLSGGKKTAPHEALHWRWVDQAAILEHPHKLLIPGEGPPLLFDISNPDHEHRDHDLSAAQPEVAARLKQKLDAWLATLNPPGPPKQLVPHRQENFVDHEIMPAPAGDP